jgi:DNA-binding transcriptional LysR family regulator
MLESVSLDQLRTFIAAVDEGSFSAAGRRLGRAQSVVSQTVANLERQLGVKLFDRSSRFPVLTEQGRTLLADARAVTGNMDLLRARAKGLSGGLEPELSVVADVMFPIAMFTGAITALQKRFPSIALRLHVEGWGSVMRHVLEGRCAVGIMASVMPPPPQLSRERLMTMSMAMVVSPKHPLATRRAPIPTSVLAEHIQLVHTDRSDIPVGRESGVLSPKTWLLAHLEAKLAFLRAGFGFGSLPMHVVERDLATGRLLQITAEDAPGWGHVIEMSALYRADTPPGPAGRWLIDRLRQEHARRLNETTVRTAPVRRRQLRSKLRKTKRRRPR